MEKGRFANKFVASFSRRSIRSSDLIWSLKARVEEFLFEGGARAYRTVARPILPRKLVYVKCRTGTKISKEK